MLVVSVACLFAAAVVTIVVLDRDDGKSCESSFASDAGEFAPVLDTPTGEVESDIATVTSVGATLRYAMRFPVDAGISTVTIGQRFIAIDAQDWFGSVAIESGSDAVRYGVDGSAAMMSSGVALIAADEEIADDKPGAVLSMAADGSTVECRRLTGDFGDAGGSVTWDVGSKWVVAVQRGEAHVFDPAGLWQGSEVVFDARAAVEPVVLGDLLVLLPGITDFGGAQAFSLPGLADADVPQGLPRSGTAFGRPQSVAGGVAVDWLTTGQDDPQGPLLFAADGSSVVALDEGSAQPVVFDDELWLIGVGDDRAATRIDPVSGEPIVSDSPLASVVDLSVNPESTGTGHSSDGSALWDIDAGKLRRISPAGIDLATREFTTRAQRLFASAGTLVVLLFADQPDGSFVGWMAVFDI